MHKKLCGKHYMLQLHMPKMRMCRYYFQLRQKNINAFVLMQKQAKADENAYCNLAFKQVEVQKFDTD